MSAHYCDEEERLNVTTKSLENRQLAVTIEVDQGRTQQAMQRAARQIAKEVHIPGFRRGKAPYDVIVQRFGESTVRREAADLLAEDVVREALEQEGIDAYAPGELTNLVLDPITYTLTVPLNPTVDLGEYRSYRQEPKGIRVTKDEVQEALEKIREDNTVFESVERPATWDDGLALNLVAITDDSTEVLKGNGLHMVLEAGSTDPVPGFAEAVLGVTPGEERTFRLTLPPDFPQEPYRGLEAEFSVSVDDVYNQIIPELDDDLARAVGAFDSLEELEKGIRDQLGQAAQAEQDREYAGQVVEAIVEQAEVDFPPPMLEQELDRVVAEVERSITSQSRLSMDDFLRIQGQTKEEFREGLSDRAASRVTRALVLGEVVRLEGLEIEEDEIGAGIEQASASWGSRAETVRASYESESARRAMHSRLLVAKAVERLVAIARGEVEEVLAEETAPNTAGGEEAESGLAADEGVEETSSGEDVAEVEEAPPVTEEVVDPAPEAQSEQTETSGIPADEHASAEAQEAAQDAPDASTQEPEPESAQPEQTQGAGEDE